MDELKALLIFLFFVCVIFFAGFSVGNGVNRSWYERELIKRGFAEYNATTGEWQWEGEDESHIH